MDSIKFTIFTTVTFFIAIINMTKSILGKKRGSLHLKTLRSHPLTENAGQELKQKPWRKLLTGLLLMACSACFLIQPGNTCPQ